MHLADSSNLGCETTANINRERSEEGEALNEAKKGDRVQVHYTGRLEDGSVFDSSVDRDPLEFTLGERQVIPGFEKAVEGMTPGESKTALIASTDAYGQHYSEMILSVPREHLPEDFEPQVGERLELRRSDGQTFVVTVTGASSDEVTVDANHPLAGRDLTFDIELVDLKK